MVPKECVQVSVSVLGSQDSGDETAIQARAMRLKALVRSEYGFEPMQETKAYVTYLIDRRAAPQLPALLKRLETGRDEYGITDVQVRATLLRGVCLLDCLGLVAGHCTRPQTQTCASGACFCMSAERHRAWRAVGTQSGDQAVRAARRLRSRRWRRCF